MIIGLRYIRPVVMGLVLAGVWLGVALAQPPAAAGAEVSRHSQSLSVEPVSTPNGAITTPTALTVEALLGVTESKIYDVVAEGVYALRGWGIATSFAIEAHNREWWNHQPHGPELEGETP